ncbi:hypothetical protein [Spirochaeta lutea]|uniref:hypothetical protein n=1 Tax=Spirochaeta lutea TaxID=1480694 RepID=UPI0012E066C9|nr:hypothetical protein [Spirochaeta lutea]
MRNLLMLSGEYKAVQHCEQEKGYMSLGERIQLTTPPEKHSQGEYQPTSPERSSDAQNYD